MRQLGRRLEDFTEAQELIDHRVAEAEPVFFVVDGESKTGRSSVANYLVHLGRKRAASSASRTSRSSPSPGASTPARYAWRRIVHWISSLRTYAIKKNLPLTPSTRELMKAQQPSKEVTAAADYAEALTPLKPTC